MTTLLGHALLQTAGVWFALTQLAGSGKAILFWPASGLALWSLLVAGWAAWPMVLAGAVLGQSLGGHTFAVSFFSACGSAVGAACAAWLLTKKWRIDATLREPEDFLRLATIAALMAALNAGFGVTTMHTAALIPTAELATQFIQWWRGDFLGVLLVTPLMLVWRVPPHGWFARARLGESIACFFGAVTVGYWVFSDASLYGLRLGRLWVVPFLGFAALRYRRRGVLLVLALFVGQALFGARQGTGPFAQDLLANDLSSFWLFFTNATVGGMAVTYVTWERRRLQATLPWLAFVLTQSGTYELWINARERAEMLLHQAFEHSVEQMERAITERLATYSQVLRGAQGLVHAQPRVDRAAFHAFVAALRISETYPGIQGVGFAVVVPASERLQHEQEVRREGFSTYAITPPGEREVLTSIVYLEPFSGRNLRAFGYDMFSEPTRRAAMSQARDTGNVSLSGKVTLVQETSEQIQAGFLMYLPVYAQHARLDSVEARRKALRGWVYSPFRAGDLLAAVLGGEVARFDIEVYDGTALTQDRVLTDTMPSHRSEPSLFEATRHIAIAGHPWTLRIRSLPAFEALRQRDQQDIILAAGTVLSVLLTLLIWLLVRSRDAALATAIELNRELIASETQLRTMAEATPGFVARVARDGSLRSINPAGLVLLELDEPGAAIGRPLVEFIREDQRAQFLAVHESICTGGEKGTLDVEIIGMRGTQRWLQTYSAPLSHQPQGETSHLLVAHDVTERKQNEELLQHQAEKLRRLAAELADARRDARRYVAKVLHDDVQQLLVAAKFHVSSLLKASAPPDPRLTKLATLLSDCQAATRTLSARLRPPILTQDSLPQTLAWLAEWTRENSGLSVQLTCGPGLECSHDIQELLFEGVRELLLNVSKHAGVREAVVTARRDGGTIEVIVADAGQGIQRSGRGHDIAPGGLGLVRLQEQILAHGGHLETQSNAGRGTRVLLTVPVA